MVAVVHLYAQPSECFSEWPDWENIIAKGSKIEQAKSLNAKAKANLLKQFKQLVRTREEFYQGTNAYCQELNALNKSIDSLNVEIAKYKVDCTGNLDKKTVVQCEIRSSALKSRQTALQRQKEILRARRSKINKQIEADIQTFLNASLEEDDE